MGSNITKIANFKDELKNKKYNNHSGYFLDYKSQKSQSLDNLNQAMSCFVSNADFQ